VRTAELFARHAVVALDSNVLIYLLEGSGPLADAAAAIVDALEDGSGRAVFAIIGLTEVLTRPASLGNAVSFERTADELRALPNVRLVPIDAEAAIDAAWGRSAGRHLGDALHMAAARRAGATCFITNDDRVRGRAGVEVVRLADIDAEPEPVPSGSQEGAGTSTRGSSRATTPKSRRSRVSTR
jgi:predicted nucleic acid-binding protein